MHHLLKPKSKEILYRITHRLDSCPQMASVLHCDAAWERLWAGHSLNTKCISFPFQIVKPVSSSLAIHQEIVSWIFPQTLKKIKNKHGHAHSLVFPFTTWKGYLKKSLIENRSTSVKDMPQRALAVYYYDYNYYKEELCLRSESFALENDNCYINSPN